LALIVLTGCGPTAAVFTPPSSLDSATTTSIATSVEGPPTDSITVLLDRLVVAEPYTDQPYRRAMFGDDWIDTDGDCHNTRAEVLMMESSVPVTFNPNGCTVATGRWADPWSGFTSSVAADFQIDHTVPLADAWRSGAAAWSGSQRLEFANDLSSTGTLNALRGTVNASKSDHGPDGWRPPLNSTWCTYAETWTRIKLTWALTVTSSELSALRQMAATCVQNE
jgi:hypothetical protein